MDRNRPSKHRARWKQAAAAIRGTATGLVLASAWAAAGPALHAASIDMAWVPSVSPVVIVPFENQFYLAGGFKYFSRRVGNGVITDLNNGDNLTAALEIEGALRCAVADGSGGWYIGGDFTSVRGQKRGHVAHLAADGTLDGAFSPNVVGSVRALLLHGGTLYLGGNFLTVQESPRSSLAALGQDGSLLPWAPVVTGGSTMAVKALAWHNGAVHVGGEFTAINGVTRTCLAAIDASGTLTSWDPQLQPGSCGYPSVNCFATANGSLYIGGCFRGMLGQTRRALAGVDAAGVPLPFDVGAVSDSSVYSLASDGSALFVGSSLSNLGGQVNNGLAAVDLGTGLATAFSAPAVGMVNCVAVAGTTLYIGTAFSYPFNNSSRYWVAALDTATGAPLPWDPMVTGSVMSLCPSSGRLLVGGTMRGAGRDAQERLGVAAVDTSGNLSAWAPDLTYSANSVVCYALAVNDSAVFVGAGPVGTSTFSRPNLLALDRSTGAGLPGFNASAAAATIRVLTATASTLYVGGTFSALGGQTRNNLAALDAGTGLALPFRADANGAVNKLALSPSQLYAAGFFTQLSASSRQGLGAVDPATGALKPFDVAPVLSESSSNTFVAIQLAGNDVFLAGTFTYLKGVARRHLARVDALGTILPFDAQIPSTSGYNPQITLLGGSLILDSYINSRMQNYFRNCFWPLDAGTGALGDWRVKGVGQYTQVVANGSVLAANSGPVDDRGGDNFSLLTAGPEAPPDGGEYGDSNLASETVLTPGGATVTRSFHDAYEADEGDRFSFPVTLGQAYHVETSALGGGADPVLYLYRSPYNDSNPLQGLLAASDDRSPGDLNAQVEWVSDYTGTAHIRVVPLNGRLTGSGVSYSLGVSVGGSGATPSATPSATESATPSATESATPSATERATASPTETGSVTESPTISNSPSATSTPSVTPGTTESATPTPSVTPGTTESATPTSSVTHTPSATPSPAGSATASPTGMWSVTESPTISNSPSATQTASATPTPSVTQAGTITATPTATSNGGSAPSPPSTPSLGAEVLSVSAAPNPNPLSVYIDLQGTPQALHFEVFSSALTSVLAWDEGTLPQGWNQVAVAAGMQTLPNGLYFLQVKAQGASGTWSAGSSFNLYILH